MGEASVHAPSVARWLLPCKGLINTLSNVGCVLMLAAIVACTSRERQKKKITHGGLHSFLFQECSYNDLATKVLF